jgi:hypothetical protein
MKINQLFVKKVDMAVLIELLHCFGLLDLNDRRLFNKHDLVMHNTVSKIENMRDKLTVFYLPCKASIYMSDMTEKRAITILKQVVRLYGYALLSKEKNVHNKKVIFYQLISEKEREVPNHMKRINHHKILNFD